MAPSGKKASKPVFKTDIPFTGTKWPSISERDQDIILDILCDLLEPIGHHRRTHIQPSKGKKRKRKPAFPLDVTQGAKSTKKDLQDEDTAPPPPPDLNTHILVGLNSVTRHLSDLAARNAPATLPITQKHGNDVDQDDKKERKEPRHLSMVILTHPSPNSSLAHAHLPTLVYLSTISSNSRINPTITSTPTSLDDSTPSSNRTTRLVALTTSSEPKLASALHIPRVGAIGILEGAPGADALADYVRSNIGPVECRWVEEGLKAEWKGVKTSMQIS